MSDDLYFTRLRFTGARGIAKLHGREVLLQTCPQLPGLAVVVKEIDYTPEVHCCRMRADFDGWREMEGDEIAAADRALKQLCPPA